MCSSLTSGFLTISEASWLLLSEHQHPLCQTPPPEIWAGTRSKTWLSALRRATAPLLHRLLPPLGDCRWASGQWHTVTGVSPQALRVVFNQVEAGGPLDCIDPEGRSIGGSACATSLALNRLLLRCSYWPIHHMFRSIVSLLMENNWSFPRTCCCCTAALKETTCEGCF